MNKTRDDKNVSAPGSQPGGGSKNRAEPKDAPAETSREPITRAAEGADAGMIADDGVHFQKKPLPNQGRSDEALRDRWTPSEKDEEINPGSYATRETNGDGDRTGESSE